MNTMKLAQATHAVPSPGGAGDSVVEQVAQHSRAAFFIARDTGKQTARSETTSLSLRWLAKSHSPRVAIKTSGKIVFINLCDVFSVQANGKYVWLRGNASSYLLRESISVVAERLETHGFIRIHRSVLVNTSFVEEIRPLSTGEYSLRVEGGKEYTVTRMYKKNLKSLAEFWSGNSLFPG
jgi:DNA-binding LytR/AlgR family response regulator